jgi:large subunit ribosomal protein L10
MNGAPLTPADVDAIAQLPSRETLEARLVGMIASPLSGLASAMNNIIAGLARQLQQIADQGLVGGSAPAAPAADAAPEPEPAAEAADATPTDTPTETPTEE